MRKFLFKLTILCLVGWPALSLASLGNSVGSVENDNRAMKAIHSSSVNVGYTTHELKKSTYTVKEFVSQDGTVFAVSWRGKTVPELSGLLGPYFNEYDQVRSQTPKNHGKRFSEIKTSKAVVRNGGHMGDLHGLAYDPSLVPAGVIVENLK